VNEESIELTELPENPVGGTKRMVMHLNFGEAGGSATYAIHDEKGRRTNVCYAYDTRGKGEAGFFVNGSELMPWKELRARFAELIKPRAA
jgi:hypothetical protein